MEKLRGQLIRENDIIKITLNKEIKAGKIFYKNSLESEKKFIREIKNEKLVIVKDPNRKNRTFYFIEGDGEEILLAERLIPLKEFCNFRDLGGFYAEDGRMVKWGKIYRSEAVLKMDSDDMEYFKKLGIKYIFDYRSEGEVSKNKDLEFEDVENINISAMNDENNKSLDMEAYFYKFIGKEEKVSPKEILKESYKKMPFNNKAYKKLVEVFKDYNNAPILQHCTVTNSL